MDDLSEKLNILNCPVCFERLRPPIRTCQNGHGVCENCRKKINICGVCRSNFSDKSNTLLNQLVEKIPLKCKYHSQGCNKSLCFDKLIDHERICYYKKDKCVCCNEEFAFSAVNDHLKNCEKDCGRASFEMKFLTEKTVNCSITQKHTNRYSLPYISSIQTYFFIRFIDNQKKVYFCIQYMGKNQENAEKYKYRVRIYRGLSDSYVSYSGYCVPYIYSAEEVKSQKGTVKLDLKSIFLTDDAFTSKTFDMEITLSEVEAQESEEKCIICESKVRMSKMNNHVKNCGTSKRLETTFSTEEKIDCVIAETEQDHYMLVYITNVETHFLWRCIQDRDKMFFCVQYLGRDQENAGKYKYRINIYQGLGDSYLSFTGICVPYIRSVEEVKKDKGRIEVNIQSFFLTDDVYTSKKVELEITFNELNNLKKGKRGRK